MYILLSACQNPAILRVIYFVSILFNVFCTLVPIALIVIILIDFSKAVIYGNDEKAVKESKIVIKRFKFAIFIFAVPWIVNAIMNIISESGITVNYLECFNNAKSGNYAYYDKLWEEENKIITNELQNKINNNNNKNNNNNNNSNNGLINPNANNISNNNLIYVSPNTNDYDMSNTGSSGAERLINVAMAELGRTDGTRYGATGSQSWCAFFTTWALKKATSDSGDSLYNHITKGSSVSNGAASGLWPAFRNSNPNTSFNMGMAYGGNYTPKKGDIIWFQWNNGYCRRNYGRWNGSNQCSDHVGMVKSYSGGTVYTIEGNSGGQVREKSYNINSDNIIAYGSWY